MWAGAIMGGDGVKTALILLLVFIRGATNDVNDIMEKNVTAKNEERRSLIARVKKMAHLGKEARVVNALRENEKEGCPPRLAEFLV